MPRKARRKDETAATVGRGSMSATPPTDLGWLRAVYALHTFSYRDPRSASSSCIGLPVISPTAVLLGIASTLFNFGRAGEARLFLDSAHLCQVLVDPPQGAIFFRAFHQLRRYYSTTKGQTQKAGLTNVNQGTREYALLDGDITVYVGVPRALVDSTRLALANREHLGTHDSLCSLVGNVDSCDEPLDVVCQPLDAKEIPIVADAPVTTITLSRFNRQLSPTVANRWWMAGADNTDLVPYVIRGQFRGTSRGKIYRKWPT